MVTMTPFLVRNGGMDPYDSPLRSRIVVPRNPFLHSLLRASQMRTLNMKRFRLSGLGLVWVLGLGTMLQSRVNKMGYRCPLFWRLQGVLSRCNSVNRDFN